MPQIKIDRIISFSSEDTVHVAANILSGDTKKKWKCASPGEKTATIVFQFEQVCPITGVDVGNEHSAYIEILVSRSGTPDDWKVFLVMSSLMTPLEARQSQNVNQVRMFKQEHFSKPTCEEKWDRIKIVCTQPFNKHVQYGLSFANFYTSEGKDVAKPVQTTIGKFTLRPESPDILSAGSLFARRKELQQDKPLKGPAAIREASNSAHSGSPITKPKLKISSNHTPRLDKVRSSESPKPRNRDELLYNKDEEERKEKIDRIIDLKTKEKESSKEKQTTAATVSKRTDKKQDHNKGGKPNVVLDTSSCKAKEKDKELMKRKHDESMERQSKKQKKEKICRPFNRLLEDVVLVISGIPNPDRSNLRTSALSMGAKYKADWDNTCTHLICAFTNTPKFNQVKGKGKIVTRKWIEECNRLRKKLPWRRYALEKSEQKEDSEDEISESIEAAATAADLRGSDDSWEAGSDTEQRVQKILALQNKKPQTSDIYSADTDDEDISLISESNFPSLDENILKSFFDDKLFYIDNSFEDDEYNMIRKYVVAYKGKLCEDPTEKVDITITNKINSAVLKEINSSAVCLTPDWIWDCHNKQKCVPTSDYIV